MHQLTLEEVKDWAAKNKNTQYPNKGSINHRCALAQCAKSKFGPKAMWVSGCGNINNSEIIHPDFPAFHLTDVFDNSFSMGKMYTGQDVLFLIKIAGLVHD